MKKTLRIVMLPLLCFSLVGCGNTSSTDSNEASSSQSSNDDSYQEETPIMVSDEELGKYDNIATFYDNKMKMTTGSSQEVPDPFVYRFNGMYYLYPTTGGGNIRAYKSADLLNWTPVSNGVLPDGIVYSYSSDGSSAPESKTPFAPEVTYYNGVFYLVTSPSGNGHYLFTSDSPEGPFTCASENLERSIDGSFFTDSDGTPYLFGASSSAINVYQMNDDRTSFASDDSGNGIDSTLLKCKIGNWNEGPYMLKRNGAYYLTYCGAHYLSSDYRVDYAYCPAGSNIMKASSYTREDTVVLSTDSEFKGLGHSCTILGPDMDSYFLAYHNLDKANQRYFNLSRLSFNGSQMVANGVTTTDIPFVNGPVFSSTDITGFNEEGNFYLSPSATGKDFTVEFNNAGIGDMIFSYIDDKNYAYLNFDDSQIVIKKVLNGETKDIQTITLPLQYSTDVLHTFRLQHHKGKMNFYFDSMEEIALEDAYFKAGKMGYRKDNNYSEIGYSAFSNVALGSSDSKYYADEVSLANSYDERLSYLTSGSGLETVEKSGYFVQTGSSNLKLANKDDRATYRFYASEEGTYDIQVRVPTSSLGKHIGLRIDNQDIIDCSITSTAAGVKNGDSQVTLKQVSLSQGQHNISLICLGDIFSFNKLTYSLAEKGSSLDVSFNSKTVLSSFTTRNEMNLSDQGIFTDNKNACGIFTSDSYYNATVECTLSTDSFSSVGFAGIAMNVTDYSTNCADDADGQDNTDSFRGLEFIIDASNAYVNLVDFNYSMNLKTVSNAFSLGTTHTLKVVQNDNNYQFYIDGKLVINYTVNVSNLKGRVGLFSSDTETYFKSLKIN